VYSFVPSTRQPVFQANPWQWPKASWLLTFFGFTAFGLLNFGYRYLDNLARGIQHTFANRLFEEMTGAYVGLLLFPLVLRLIRSTRIRRSNWWSAVPLTLLVMIGFSLADTTGMSITRRLLSPVFGLGQYDYGIMLYRYPMEFALHVLLFWFAVGAIYVFDSYREAQNRQLASADLEARLAEAQFENLRLQLQPHFLFNALNTISSVMYEDVRRADSMVAQLCDLLRRTLHTGPSQEVSLEEELALVKSYVAVMEERFGDDLKVEFKVDPDLIQALVPQLILQPLVENSIRHARRPQTAGLRLRISATQDKSDLLLQVHDDGPGLPSPVEGFIKGIGLSNTEQRLRRLYGTRQQMLLENVNGLRVTIRLPLHLEAVPA
jgi:two-component system, LytTR family, sensor kinase